MNKITYTALIIIFGLSTYAQVGIGTNNPDNSAMLEIATTEKGILFPRMSSTQRNNIIAPANGLHVFDTNTNSLWYYNGTYWVNSKSEASEGDVKSGIQIADHAGWVLLDGRPLSSLSVNQQAVATSLGLIGNLPDATNAYLVQNGGTIAGVSGSNTTTLTQANLPNINFSGTAASAGNHTHDVDPVAVNSTTNGNHSHGGTTNVSGNHSHSYTDYYYAEHQGFSWGWAGSNNGVDFDNAGYATTGTTVAAGNHSHTISTDTQGNHTHSVDIPTTTSTTNGVHTHIVTVSSGGSNTPINIAPRSLTVNMFIYLGL